MGLVDYSDSDAEAEQASTSPPAKKRRVSRPHAAESLPPLPATFLDQYSSTVRTSTQDDPSLHGGRKRAAPHIEGHWPTHVYLEWHPTPAQYEVFSSLIESTGRATDDAKSKQETTKIHSLLQNDLEVNLPLHISLSRPLILKTAEKDRFLDRLKHSLHDQGVKALGTNAEDLVWHANESSTRWFLVLRMHASKELSQLLDICNSVAKEFQQPLLYADNADNEIRDQFHISIAWSLQRPTIEETGGRSTDPSVVQGVNSSAHTSIEKLRSLQITFAEVKVRIGQDVNVLPLRTRR